MLPLFLVSLGTRCDSVAVSVLGVPAIAVTAGSRSRRTCRNCSTLSSRWKSTTKAIASMSIAGSRLVT